MLRPLHVVQVGYDDSVFTENAPSDTLQRQVGYGRELARQRPGSRMTVIMFTNRSNARKFQQESVVFVPVHGIRTHELPRLFPCLVSLHKQRPIDVIATQTIYYDAWIALLFGRLHGINVIGQVHYDFFTATSGVGAQGGGLLNRARAGLGLRMMRHLFAVRVVSQKVRDRMLAENLHPNVQVVGIPATIALPADLERQLDSPKFSVLFVGRLIPVKNLNVWMQVAATVAATNSAVQFDVVGDGPLRDELKALAEQLGIAERVRFRGFLSYDQLPPVYASSAAFLITSQSEGLPRVVMEASFHGVPVVGPRIAGVEDIVENGESGFLHDSGDIEGMAESVLRLLSDDELRRRMGRAGYESVKSRFSPGKLSREWVSLLISGARDVEVPVASSAPLDTFQGSMPNDDADRSRL